ncbi:MAG TPA: heme o synthase [Candidatus Paceibacterota bacterium]|nr:heme o synthase [Candidatus Paceibacterota bacterium]
MKWNFVRESVSEETRPFTLPGQRATSARFNEYYDLVKPGIVYGNTIVAIAAYLFASRWVLDVQIFSGLIVGLAFVIGSAAILNNYFDRHIDALMERTKNRALATGAISTSFALIFSAILGLVGFGILYALVNPLSAFSALAGFLVYLGLYGPSKRATPWGVVIGAVAGAIPTFVGYAAATGRIDLPALLLFSILFIWQLPHFFAISLYRYDEYAAAKIPTFAFKMGIPPTKYAIVTTIILFTAAVGLLSSFGYTGGLFAIAMALVCAVWFVSALRGFKATDTKAWARRMFYISLLVIFAFTILLSVGPILP